jgi:integron integrase
LTWRNITVIIGPNIGHIEMGDQEKSEEKRAAKGPRLLEQVRQVMRLHHYSLHTERAYLEWIRRYVRFHRMQRREDLAGGQAKIEAFLTDLAVNGRVAPATQNQALNALVFLYKKVLEVPLAERIDAVRAERKTNVPVVLTREEVARVLPLVEGVSHLVVKLLYGSGLRIMEALRLRVKDVDFGMKQITVRDGKGAKDRVTTFAGSMIPLLQNHLQKVKVVHEQDLAAGHGTVYLPYALERKYPNANREWGWQYLFPARELSTDPRTGVVRRHQVLDATFQHFVREAGWRAGLDKKVMHTPYFPALGSRLAALGRRTAQTVRQANARQEIARRFARRQRRLAHRLGHVQLVTHVLLLLWSLTLRLNCHGARQDFRWRTRFGPPQRHPCSSSLRLVVKWTRTRPGRGRQRRRPRWAWLRLLANSEIALESLSRPQLLPASRFVTGASKALRIDKRFHHLHRITKMLLPILGESLPGQL